MVTLIVNNAERLHIFADHQKNGICYFLKFISTCLKRWDIAERLINWCLMERPRLTLIRRGTSRHRNAICNSSIIRWFWCDCVLTSLSSSDVKEDRDGPAVFSNSDSVLWWNLEANSDCSMNLNCYWLYLISTADEDLCTRIICPIKFVVLSENFNFFVVEATSSIFIIMFHIIFSPFTFCWSHFLNNS